MKRLAAIVIALTAIAGCQGQNRPPAPNDPFLFGPTRVPPPPTGAAVGRGADAYYHGPAPRQQAIPPGPQGSGSIGPIGARPSLPPRPLSAAARPEPGSWSPTYADPSAPAPASRVPAPETLAQNGGRAPNLLAGREQVVRTLPPRNDAGGPRYLVPTPATRQSYPVRPRPTNRRVDISELPASNSHSAAPAPSDAGGPAFRLVSGTDDAADGSARVDRALATEPAPTTSLFGHAADYSWVRGKLEHSQVDGRWKLRYIPIDGKTDDFGGSVVVVDSSVLSGYERGEFIELRGELGEVETEAGFAPLYEVAEVVRSGRASR